MIKRIVELLFMVGVYLGIRALEAVGTIKPQSPDQRESDWLDFKKMIRDVAVGRTALEL